MGRGVNESEERRRELELEEQETQARLERYREQRGGVKPAIERQQEDNIRQSLQISRSYMMRGMYKEAVDELRARDVEVHIASTPNSSTVYNEWLSQQPEDSVAALFHTGCL